MFLSFKVTCPMPNLFTALYKSFPEMLLRRANDDGVVRLPIGSYDTMPMVGKIGTGVEVNEVFTRFEQGSLKQTNNPFDVALRHVVGAAYEPDPSNDAGNPQHLLFVDCLTQEER